MPLTLSPEGRIVFLTAAGKAGDEEIRNLLRRDPNWQRLLALASAHKAASALARTLERIAAGSVPENVALQLQRQRMVSDFHSLHLRQKLVATLKLLRERGVTAMMLKGAAMGAAIYRSFVERPMADIDLLIHPQDVIAAQGALADAGWVAQENPFRNPFYEQHHHLAPLKDAMGSGHSIELHIRPFPPPNPFGDVTPEMWQDAVVADAEFSGALVPSRTHMLVYACVHFAWSHTMSKGAWRTIRDVAALSAESLDWEDVIETARSWRASSSCYWTLRLCEALSAVSAPAHVLSRLSPPLPMALASALERHLVAHAVPGELPLCPSERVTHLLWRAAIRPRWSGHVAGAPADHAPPWVTSGTHAEVEESGMEGGTLRRLREWSGYFGSIFFSRPGRLKSVL